MKLFSFFEQAEAEFLAMVEHYAEIRSDLGSRFRSAAFNTIDIAMKHPLHGGQSEGVARKRRVRGFPFNVIYLNEPERLLIIAVAHHKCKPGYWQSRISGR